MTRRYIFVHGMLALAAATSVASGTIITNTTTFGPSKVVESFENISPRGQNMPLPTSYVLPSGSTFSVSAGAGVSFVPYIVNGGFFGMFGGDARVPNGTAYLGQANPGSNDTGLYFTFPTNQTRIGANIAVDTNDTNVPLYIEVLGASNNVLASTTIRGYTIDNWANDFIGFEGVGNIRAIHFDGFGSGVLRIDSLTSQTAPEPAIAALAAAALFVARRRVRRS